MSILNTLRQRLRLIRMLRRHIKLAERRNPMWEQNKAAKYVIGFMLCFSFLYMIFLAVMFALIANTTETYTSYELPYSVLPFILLIDFLFRFLGQQTPSQMIRPYTLLPISRYACIESFLVSSLISKGNFTWFVIFIPYALMSVVFSYGMLYTVGFMLGLYLFILINSQWYVLVRSLVKQSLWWWTLPLAVYALLMAPIFASGKMDFLNLMDFYSIIGDKLSAFSPLSYLAVLAALGGFVAINRKTQYRFIWSELSSSTKSKTLKTVSSLSFFDKWGETGEYLKLEVKSIMRNKSIRISAISGIAVVVLFSLLLSFTDVYDNFIMTNFWCLYCFALYGGMVLIKIMCYEGNYIDCLMVHKENILSLLKAKYIISSSILVLPFILLLPTVFTGKCTLLMLFAYAFFAAGVLYCMYFQLAVYNKQTVPLNAKFIGKGSAENNYVQMIVNLSAFTMPLVFVFFIERIVGETAAHLIIMAVGILFVATSNIWMRNIYNRMMRRKYANLDSFRATR